MLKGVCYFSMKTLLSEKYAFWETLYKNWRVNIVKIKILWFYMEMQYVPNYFLTDATNNRKEASKV